MKLKGKVAKVTLKSLESDDHYRAQVQVPNKLVWAILYNAIYDRSADSAKPLRDAFGVKIQELVISHASTLLNCSDFAWYLSDWIHNDSKVAPEIRPRVLRFINETFGDVLPKRRIGQAV